MIKIIVDVDKPSPDKPVTKTTTVNVFGITVYSRAIYWRIQYDSTGPRLTEILK
jgi:hypothetical protein